MDDAFENAARNANPDCPKCKGTGQYCYTRIGTPHFTICDLCCLHNQGYWRLSSSYSGYPGMCCRAGCGLVRRTPFEALVRWALDQLNKVGLWPWFGWSMIKWRLKYRYRWTTKGWKL